MNTNNIKRYAPKARTAFIAAMSKRAALFGIKESSIPAMGIEPLEQKGDLALIGDRAFPAAIARPRAALVKKVEQMGFAQAIEHAAYSWFNRLCAIRYMELKGYLEHGRRVLSHPDQPGSFQILDDCLDIELEGMDRQRITELKLDGSKDEELYRELLLAQCHALHKAMPFLFEAVDDATELLLPDNLTKTDSLIRELVDALPEDDWQDVEIIGWLYQFYISEKKDQVMGKVVKSEDIPAATQLFTPNWIVQYLVQNSVGRQWLQTYPDSPLKAKMPYYIEPAEQAPDVAAALASITPDSIDPLTIKVLDPACGSGHILVEAYKLLKDIYTERGFRSRDIPQLILENNLFGLDIDDRAGQLAGFALMMLARADDRRIFNRMAENGFKLNVLSLQESSHLDFEKLWKSLNLASDWQRNSIQDMYDSEQGNLGAAEADNRYQLLKTTLARFTQAKTFGSLIEVPAEDAEPLGELLEQLRQLGRDGDVMQKPAAEQLIPYIQQAWVLAQRYDAVVANPPYMGSGGMNTTLKVFANKQYPNSKSDLFAIFIERGFGWLKLAGHNAMITIQNWMFISSYEKLRKYILKEKTINSLMQIGYNSFPELNSKVVQCTAFSIQNTAIEEVSGVYINLNSAPQSADKRNVFLEKNKNTIFTRHQNDFSRIPSSPIAYWLSSTMVETFTESTLGDYTFGQGKNVTSNNDKFMRLWWEISIEDVGQGKKWLSYAKGGDFRKWYGNLEHVVDWSDSARQYYKKQMAGRIISEDQWYLEGITWTDITSSGTGFRYLPPGATFDTTGLTVFIRDPEKIYPILGVLNSNFSKYALDAINPTLHANLIDVKAIPIPQELPAISEEVLGAISLSKTDWDASETSLNYRTPFQASQLALATTYSEFLLSCQDKKDKLIKIERTINSKVHESLNLEGFDPAFCKVVVASAVFLSCYFQWRLLPLWVECDGADRLPISRGP